MSTHVKNFTGTVPERFQTPKAATPHFHCRDCVQFPRGAKRFGCAVMAKVVLHDSGVCNNREAKMRGATA